MTFSVQETSVESGAPVELYQFRVGTESHNFTNVEDAWSILGTTFNPEVISRSRIVKASDRQGGEGIDVEVPHDNSLALKYRDVIPGELVTLSLFHVHRTDLVLQTVLIFEGVVRNATYVQDGKRVRFNVSSITSAATRTMPRYTYQGNCNHNLYDSRCKILEGSFEAFLTVTVVSGRTVTIPGASALSVLTDYLVAGFVQASGDFRMVTAQAGNVLTLTLPFSQSPLNAVVRLLPGCKLRLTTDCRDKFNNVINFGGFPYVPEKNPFETGID